MKDYINKITIQRNEFDRVTIKIILDIIAN